MKKHLFLMFIGSFLTMNLAAQKDSLIMINNNYIAGEVKSMDRNILVIETDYSDDDFTIEWDGIREIYTETYFLITLTDGSRHNSHIKSTGPGKISLVSDDGQTLEVDQQDIVILDGIDQGWNFATEKLG